MVAIRAPVTESSTRTASPPARAAAGSVARGRCAACHVSPPAATATTASSAAALGGRRDVVRLADARVRPAPGGELGTAVTRQIERRRLAEYGGVKALQGGPGLDPELVDRLPPSRAVLLQRLRLTITAIQREHQLRPKSLLKWMTLHERVQLAHQTRVLTEVQPRVTHVADGGQPELFQSPGLQLHGRRIRELRQRRPPPQRQPGGQHPACIRGAPRAQGLLPVRGEPLEPRGIESFLTDDERIAARSRHQHAARGTRHPRWLERASQL